MYFFSTIVVILISGNSVFSATYQKKYYAVEEYESLFDEFITKYERIYEDEQEKQLRYEIFKNNMELINELNSRNEHAVFGINKFTDYTEQELEMLRGFKPSSEEKNLCNTISEDEKIFLKADEEVFDWREHNAVTEVKRQGSCGSCYAFSTIGNIEGQYAIQNKELVSFSEQQIVDCDKNEGRGGGCHRGLMYNAMTALMDMGGVMTENDYPYTGTEDTCKLDRKKVKVQLLGCNAFNVTNEDKLKNILKTVGPLSVGIVANPLKWYKGGIIKHSCKGETPGHAVLLVGWGSENGVPYWVLKNSMGSEFGEQGYFRLHRGINSCCLVGPYNGLSSAVLSQK